LALALDFIEGRAAKRSATTRRPLTGYGVDLLSRIPGVDSLAAASAGSASCPSTSTVCTRTMSAPCLTSMMSRSGSPSLRAAADGQARHRRTVRASFGVYNDEADLDARGGGRSVPGDVPAMSDELRELYQDISSTMAATAQFSCPGAPDASGAGPQPAVRRPGHGVSGVEGERIADVSFEGRGCAISTARLR